MSFLAWIRLPDMAVEWALFIYPNARKEPYHGQQTNHSTYQHQGAEPSPI
jgi:hypothetical protein